MQLDRFELADIHHPSALARKLHGLLGPLTSAVPILDIARALDIADVRLDRFDGFEGMLLELLAPAYLMASGLSEEPDLRDAQRLRDHLDVSLEACLRRMIECRSEALAAVWSHEGRVRYFVRVAGAS